MPPARHDVVLAGRHKDVRIVVNIAGHFSISTTRAARGARAVFVVAGGECHGSGSHFFSAGSRWIGSTHNTASGFSTGSMSRLMAMA